MDQDGVKRTLQKKMSKTKSSVSRVSTQLRSTELAKQPQPQPLVEPEKTAADVEYENHVEWLQRKLRVDKIKAALNMAFLEEQKELKAQRIQMNGSELEIEICLEAPKQKRFKPVMAVPNVTISTQSVESAAPARTKTIQVDQLSFGNRTHGSTGPSIENITAKHSFRSYLRESQTKI